MAAKYTEYGPQIDVKYMPVIKAENVVNLPWKRTGFALREQDETAYRNSNLARFNQNGYLRLSKIREITGNEQT
jgi:hypothetical protein